MRDIVDVVRDGIEKSEPAETILAYWKERAGKPFTTRDIAKLRERCKDDSITEDRVAGMSSITWGGYRQSSGNTGGSLLFSYSPTNRVIDPAFLEERNAAYFAARKQRNEMRRAFLANGDAIKETRDLFEAYASARAHLDAIEAKVKKLIMHPDGPLSPDRFTIEKEILGKES